MEGHGAAFANYSENFVRLDANKYSQYTAYVSSQSQFSYDPSISGVSVLSGVYLNNTFVPNNTSGLIIDYVHGVALFSGIQNGKVSGNYSAHEINIYPTKEKEETLLFEKKYVSNPKTLPQFTGRKPDDTSVPCLFVKTKAGDNNVLCFDGTAQTTMTARFIMISDSQFVADGILSLFRDAQNTFIPLLTTDQLPFNNFGNIQSSGWNYLSYLSNTPPNRVLYLEKVAISEFTEEINFELGKNCVGAMIDCDFSAIRQPKLS